ncbi:Short-chain dehydrogenase/reductase SDR [Neofusicoccum parvum]|nr:Short-chain dehydrogenase/reductase SDR [Neofusicoccum parvum]
MSSFAGEVFAITGAGSGIGLATACLLSTRGAAVSLSDLNADNLAKAKATILASTPDALVLVTPLDIRDRGAVALWIKATISEFGTLTGAANMAGIVNEGINIKAVDETPDEEWDQVLGVNLKGTMVCVSEEVREMKLLTQKAPKENRGFSIVNASSIVGLRGHARASAYSAAKHGVLGLTKSVAKEVGEWNIRVNAVAPGTILTPMTLGQPGAKEGHEQWNKLAPLGRSGTPEEVAELVIWLLGSQSSFVTGAVYEIDGGILS